MKESEFQWGPHPPTPTTIASFEQYPDDEHCYLAIEGVWRGEWIRSNYTTEIKP